MLFRNGYLLVNGKKLRVQKNLENTVRVLSIWYLFYYIQVLYLLASDKNIIDRSPVSTTKDSQVEHEGFEHFLNNIKETHPDSQEIANNPVFKKYINSLPGNKYIKTLHNISRTEAERILEDCTTEGIIQLISNYKSQEDYQKSHRLFIIMMSVKR